MRCLIPITQEMRNPNALKRAQILCDEIHILYVLDRALLDRMKRESAYVLDSETLKAIEDTVIGSQREEATEFLRAAQKQGKKVQLHFEVGDYPEVLERHILRLRPQLLMTDAFSRSLLSLKVPIWVDAGNEIKRCVFVVESVTKIRNLKKDFELLRTVCGRIQCDMGIFSKSNERSTIETLKRFAEITGLTGADLLCLQFFDRKSIKTERSFIILSN